MPLTAFLEVRQEAIIAPFLTDAQWATLQRETQAGEKRLTLSCCGGGAYLRTSPRGLKHFAHLPNQTNCENARQETLEHLKAKTEIALTCRANGYQVFIEYPYADWRADVYAEKNGDKLAFEVQWSAQTLIETEKRHARYLRDGVRDCWFFRALPTEYQPNAELPAFQLAIDEGENTGVHFLRKISGDFGTSEIYALGDFVSGLLNRQIRFCTHAQAGAAQQLEIVFFYTHCYRCKKTVYLYTVSNPHSDCGLELLLTPLQRLKLSFDGAIRAAVRQWRTSDEGKRLHISENGYRFRCANCGAEQKDIRVIELMEHIRQGLGDTSARIRRDILLSNTPSIVLPHWCFPRSGDFCCEQTP